MPVERIEAAVIRHYTSRAGDPHRHLHLQINARVLAAGAWRGLHSVGVRDIIEAINGIGHAAVATDPEFRAVLAAHGLHPGRRDRGDRGAGAVRRAFSARAAQIHRNIDRYEAEWRREHPGQEPGPRLREAWDRRAWADARPDKVVPTDGAELVATVGTTSCAQLGYRDPAAPAVPLRRRRQVGWIDRDGAADWVISQLGAKRSAWNAADIRGKVEVLLAQTDLVAEPAARDRARRGRHRPRRSHAVSGCSPRPDVPEHVRALTSQQVLEVEADLVAPPRPPRRAARPARPAPTAARPTRVDPAQAAVVGALAGDAPAGGRGGRGRCRQDHRAAVGRRPCWHGRDIGCWW